MIVITRRGYSSKTLITTIPNVWIFFKNNYMIMITLLKKIINLANNYLINMTTPTFDMSSWIFCQDCIINSFCRSVRSGMGGAGSLTCAGDPFAESSFVLRYVFLFDDEIFSPCLNASFRLFLAFIQPIVILFAFRAFTIWMFTFRTCTFQRKKNFLPFFNTMHGTDYSYSIEPP